MQNGRRTAAIGFTVKSGWTSAVLLVGPATAPVVVDSRRVDLSDPAIPESRQPYHAGFATARPDGPERAQLIAGVTRFGRQSVTRLLREYQSAGHRVGGVGVVVGSLIDPERIANEHIRIHAREGQLFRGIVQDAASRLGLGCAIWRDRDLYALAASRLKRSEPGIRDAVSAFGREASGPWRAEQKGAALAAWLVLTGVGLAQPEPSIERSVRQSRQG